MEQALAVEGEMLRTLTQIILVGMPGCGKSSLGHMLAERLGRRFVDMDDWIEAKAGVPVPRIIESKGSPAFGRWSARPAGAGKEKAWSSPRRRCGLGSAQRTCASRMDGSFLSRGI